MKSCISLVALFVSAAFVVACSSTPPIAELPNDADPTAEMGKLEVEVQAGIENQVDVLSPDNFSQAKNSLEDAKEARKNNKSQQTVLHKIAISHAYLNRAEELAKVSGQVLPGVLHSRHLAISAEAAKFFPKEFASLDSDLTGVTKDIELHDTSRAEQIRAKLERQYSDLELNSIRQSRLGRAKGIVEQAKGEGAKKWTPKILAWAEAKISAADKTIIADRYNLAVIDSSTASADSAADRLLRLVREAKNTSGQTSEQLATQLERDQMESELAEKESMQELNHSQGQLNNAKAIIENDRADISNLSAKNAELSSRQKMESEYESARQLFTEDEAEVYKQGDRLLLRLKGLTFPVAQSTITPSNYSLLTKVQQVIKESGVNTVVIEGHTDSTGSKSVNEKLSQARAEAVQRYLMANPQLENEKILASGLGEDNPIATNKTAEGRSQNRRVDVIISTVK